jgi:hypothetical protein
MARTGEQYTHQDSGLVGVESGERNNSPPYKCR